MRKAEGAEHPCVQWEQGGLDGSRLIRQSGVRSASAFWLLPAALVKVIYWGEVKHCSVLHPTGEILLLCDHVLWLCLQESCFA